MHRNNFKPEHGAYSILIGGVRTSVESVVPDHSVYHMERTWLAALTLWASLAIQLQSGRVYLLCFAVLELDNRWTLTCWDAGIRCGTEWEHRQWKIMRTRTRLLAQVSASNNEFDHCCGHQFFVSNITTTKQPRALVRLWNFEGGWVPRFTTFIQS